MAKVDLSEQGLRDRLYGIAQGLGDRRLSYAARNGSEDLIARRVAEGDYEFIMRRLFDDIPGGEQIAGAVLRYQGNRILVEKVVEQLTLTICNIDSSSEGLSQARKEARFYSDEDVSARLKGIRNRQTINRIFSELGVMFVDGVNPTAAREVLKLTELYRGKRLYTVLDHALDGLVGYSSKGQKVVVKLFASEEVAAVANRLTTERATTLLNTVEKVIEGCPNSDVRTVRKVAQVAEKFRRRKEFDEVMKVIADTVEKTDHAREIVEKANEYLDAA